MLSKKKGKPSCFSFSLFVSPLKLESSSAYDLLIELKLLRKPTDIDRSIKGDPEKYLQRSNVTNNKIHKKIELFITWNLLGRLYLNFVTLFCFSLYHISFNCSAPYLYIDEKFIWMISSSTLLFRGAKASGIELSIFMHVRDCWLSSFLVTLHALIRFCMSKECTKQWCDS